MYLIKTSICYHLSRIILNFKCRLEISTEMYTSLDQFLNRLLQASFIRRPVCLLLILVQRPILSAGKVLGLKKLSVSN